MAESGTSILHRVGLGFSNRVRRGSIGLVGTSGTGLQEVTTMIHRLGGGISHAIGTGGRDLDLKISGITTLQAIELLARDPDTRVVVLVSKPASHGVADRVLAVIVPPPPAIRTPGRDKASPGAVIALGPCAILRRRETVVNSQHE